jgi:VWFA-related protein
MKFAFTVAVVLLASFSAQEQRYRFETRVEAVAVDVAVVHDGRPVNGLTAQDFEIRDNGVLQEIDRVQVESAPVNSILVLDNSESVTGLKFLELRSAARAFVAGLGEDDRAALVTFSYHPQLRQDFTSTPSSVFRALEETTAAGGTALYEALYAGLMLADPPAVRPIIVLFSDGEDTTSRIDESELLGYVRESNAVVYAARTAPSVKELRAPESMDAFSTAGPKAGWAGNWWRPPSEDPNREEIKRRDEFLRRIAEETGGKFWAIENVSDIDREFLRTLNEIKARYLLTYYPNGVQEQGWHRLEVKLENRKGEVHARRGYYPSSRIK